MNAVPKPASDLLYAIDGRLHDMVMIEQVNDRLRISGHFDGTLTEGELAGGQGVALFRLARCAPLPGHNRVVVLRRTLEAAYTMYPVQTPR